MNQRDQIMEVAEDINATGINTGTSARLGAADTPRGSSPAPPPPYPSRRPAFRGGGPPPIANGATPTVHPAPLLSLSTGLARFFGTK